MVRCERLGLRRQRVSDEERRYAIDHWQLLARLRRALRTEPNVRLAAVYGSVARGRLDGGFSNRQAETFIELYRTRNRLQHS